MQVSIVKESKAKMNPKSITWGGGGESTMGSGSSTISASLESESDATYWIKN